MSHISIDSTILRIFSISNVLESFSIIWLLQKMNEITTHIHGINYEARIWRPENDLQYKKNISSITTRVASFYPWQKEKRIEWCASRGQQQLSLINWFNGTCMVWKLRSLLRSKSDLCSTLCHFRILYHIYIYIYIYFVNPEIFVKI